MDNKELLKDETLAEKLIKRGFWLYFFSFLIAPSGYIIKLLISNDLSVQEVGVIYSIIWFVSILTNYNDLWFTESLQYFLPKFWINKNYNKFKTSIFLALWTQTFTAILIAFWLWFGADWLWNNYFHSLFAVDALKVFSLWFIVYNLFSTLENIFKSFQDTFVYKLVEFIRMWWIVLFTIIIFFSHNWNVLTYSIAWFVGAVVWLFVAFLIFLRKYRKILNKWKIEINKETTKQIFSYSIWVIIGSQAWILLSQIDQQMIIYFLGPEQAGYYTAYLSLLTIYSIILWPLFSFLFPITTELAEKKETWKLSMMLNMFLKYFVLFGIYWWIFLFVFWPMIAFVLFWDKFTFSWELLKLWWMFIFLNIIVSILFPILAGLGKIKERVKILWTAAILNFILNICLISYIWVYGAIISTIVWQMIIVTLSFKILKKINIKLSYNRVFFLKNLLLWFVLWWIGYYFISNLQFNRVNSLFLILFSGLVYGMIILWLNYNEVRLFVNEVKKIKWR